VRKIKYYNAARLQRDEKKNKEHLDTTSGRETWHTREEKKTLVREPRERGRWPQRALTDGLAKISSEQEKVS